MKKIFFRIGILSVVFVVAVFVFSHLTNRGNNSMSADMGTPELPRISFITGEYRVNSLPAYEEDMEISSVRDTVTMANGGVLQMDIGETSHPIHKLTWQIYSLDGEECLKSETISDVKESFEIRISETSILLKERVLKLTLHLEKGDVYYYTRLKSDANCNYKQCLDYVTKFHEDAIAKQNKEMIETAIETDPSMGGYGFQDVNINSSIERVTWGSLKPEVVGDVRYDVKECNETYTSVLLSYRVTCPEIETDEGAVYDVREFFRVRLYADHMYLLDYERNMEQIFDGNKNALDENGILLGIASPDVQYKNNEEGTIVSFVQNRELWSYNKEADSLALVFSFADSEGVDERNLYDQHEINIIDVESNGSTVFTVMGYMNRGAHEGKVGVVVYYYDSEKNSVEEMAFVPTNKGYQIMKEELGKLVYYSHEEGILHVMIDGALYAINLEDDTREVLVRGLTEGQYKVSDDGKMIAYQQGGTDLYHSQKMRVLNLQNGYSYEIISSGDEYLVPIGFIKSDFAYGYLKHENMGETKVGEPVYGMHKVEIVKVTKSIAKVYEIEGVYIVGAYVEDNMMTLERAIKKKDTFKYITEDYITNNEEPEKSNIYVDTYVDEVKGYSAKIIYSNGISDNEAKVLNPKQVLKELSMELTFNDSPMKQGYYVYAHGEIQGVYEKASQAIRKAESMEGVVVSHRQAYLWERGNWPSIFEVDNVTTFKKKDGENSVTACLRKMFELEEKTVDVKTEIDAGLTPKEILDQYMDGEGVDLTGCNVKDILYIISEETPVIALIENNHAVLVYGYSQTNIVYMDPVSGRKVSVTWDTMDDMLEKNGNVLIGYLH